MTSELCYLECVKKTCMLDKNINIEDIDIFFIYKLMNFGKIGRASFGFDYNKLPFLMKFSEKEINDVFLKRQRLLCFINTKNLKYDDIYMTNKGREHCIIIEEMISETEYYIYDPHIRKSDAVFEQYRGLLNIKNLNDKIYYIDYEVLFKDIEEKSNVCLLDYCKEDIKYSFESIMDYLNECINKINTLKYFNDYIENLHYNIKINSFGVLIRYIIVYYKKNRMDCSFWVRVKEQLDLLLIKMMYYLVKNNIVEIQKELYTLIELIRECKYYIDNNIK